MASVDLGANFGNGGSTSGGGGGGGSGTVTQVNTGGLATGGPITTTGTITVSSISLSTGVTGSLPLSQTTGSVSLTNQVVGNLPLSQTSGSISLTNQVSGLLPVASLASLSFTNISGSLPLSQTTGSISLANQVSGSLSLSLLSSALTANTIDNTGFTQTWNWSTISTATAFIHNFNGITTGTGMNLASNGNSTSVTGALLKLTNTGVNSRINNLQVDNNGQDSLTRGIKVNMTGAAGAPVGIDVAYAGGSSGDAIKATVSGVAPQCAAIHGINSSTSDSPGPALGGLFECTGTSGVTISLEALNASSAGNAAFFQNSHASNNNNVLVAQHSGASGFAGYLLATGVGVRSILRLSNFITAASGSGASMVFTANRTGTSNTDFASIAGILTDASASYKGALTFSTSNNATAAEAMRIDNTGQVGIGQTVPTAQLHTTGTVRFANFGVGTATFDASGNLSSVSDEFLKDIQREFSEGLKELRKITPIIYKWKESSGLDVENEYIGWSAQNLSEAISGAVYKKKIWVGKDNKKLRDQKDHEMTLSKDEAIRLSQEPVFSKDSDGNDILSDNPEHLPDSAEKKDLLSVSDRAVMAAMVNAFKEISVRLEAIEQRLGL